MVPWGWRASRHPHLHALWLQCVAEDSSISFRFAANLASGAGLVWNPGEAPVEGYTNFLWVMMCAAAIRAGLDVVVFAQVAGLLAALGTLVVVFWWVRHIWGGSVLQAAWPALLLASAGPFATWAMSGMETPLFAFLVTAGVAAVVSFWQTGQSGRLVAGAGALLLATLTRPEGLLVFAVLTSLSLLRAIGRRERLRQQFVPAALYLTAFLVYFAWRFHRYGFLLPNTFYAKTGGMYYQYFRGLVVTAYFAIQFLVPLALWLPLVWWDTPLERATRNGWRIVSDLVRDDFGTTACVALGVCYTLYIVAVGGDYMAMHRFFVPVLPLIYLLFGRMVGPVLQRGFHDRAKRPAIAMLAAATWCGTFIHSTAAERAIFAAHQFQHGNYRGVQTERWHSARLELLGRFFKQRRRSPSESLATSAIGAIGFYADMKVYDFHGLVDTHIAHSPRPRRPDEAGRAMSAGIWHTQSVSGRPI